MIGNRLDRAPSPATVHGAHAVAAQHEQLQEPLGGGRSLSAATAHPVPAVAVQGGQSQPTLPSDGASSSQAGLAGLSLGASPHEVAFRELTFAESLREYEEEDAASSSSEKVAVSEGHRNVLRLLYQLCPGAALKSPPAPHKLCDFEGLFASVDPTLALEGVPTPFHRMAELREEHQSRFRAAAEVVKAVASALPSCCRDRGCCSDPSVASSASMNPAIPRLVGSLSNRRSFSFSFEEAARVESLCNGMLADKSAGFWSFSALLHWLKELGFEAPDPSLFGQPVEEVSGSLVTAANSVSGLATFMLAKKREGVLFNFPPHVGAHFKKDLASSYGGPLVFDNEVLARVIAASREDSNLDAQLSIAKSFTLPVFRADAKKPGQKASSDQDSSASSATSSGFRGRGRGSDSGGVKRKASSPDRSRNEKSSRRGSSPTSKRGIGCK